MGHPTAARRFPAEVFHGAVFILGGAAPFGGRSASSRMPALSWDVIIAGADGAGVGLRSAGLRRAAAASASYPEPGSASSPLPKERTHETRRFHEIAPA